MSGLQNQATPTGFYSPYKMYDPLNLGVPYYPRRVGGKKMRSSK